MDSLQGVKNKAFVNAIDVMFPEEGEIVTTRGGLGNRIIFQNKKENGVYYRRRNESEKWEEYDIHEIMIKFTNSVLKEVEEKPIHPKPRDVYENFTGTKKEHDLYTKTYEWFKGLFNKRRD